MEIDREALAWAAGFFDGEGSTIGGKRGPRSVVALLSMAQVDPESLHRFRAAVGGRGYIYGPRPSRAAGAKPHFDYRTTSFEDTQGVLALLWPWLGESKRQQALKVLRAYRVAQHRIHSECRRGHEMTPENTCPGGRCRTCRRAGQRAYYHRQKAA